jgi:hypothetical protein
VANPVPNPVQRLRYFDGEYLRSYDFTDEQSYHIEMRRLMNRELHLYGIVHGLEIAQDADSVPATNTYFFSIKHGIAIDQLGREIVVPAPYSLTNVLTQPGLAAGNCYEVWICYQEIATGLPAAGYLDCNVTNQNTRLQERFEVQLIPTQGQSVVTPCTGVRLGVVLLIESPSGFGLAIQNPSSLQTYNVKRHYVGIRAQRIIAPDEEKDAFNIAAQNIDPTKRIPLPGYLDIEPSAMERGNLIVEKNVVIGDDFALAANTNPPSPPSTGNLKVTNDLLLYGNFYGFNPSAGTSGQWFVLKDYIQSLAPVVQTGVITITFPTPTAAAPTFQATGTVTVNSGLPQVTQPLTILVALMEIDWATPATLKKDWLTPGIGTPLIVSVAGPNPVPPAAPSISLTVTATVGPVVKDTPTTFVSPVSKVVVSYMVVFTP